MIEIILKNIHKHMSCGYILCKNHCNRIERKMAMSNNFKDDFEKNRQSIDTNSHQDHTEDVEKTNQN